jgi:hypothetical protein
MDLVIRRRGAMSSYKHVQTVDSHFSDIIWIEYLLLSLFRENNKSIFRDYYYRAIIYTECLLLKQQERIIERIPQKRENGLSNINAV